MVQPPRIPGGPAFQHSRGQKRVRPAAEKVVQHFRSRELQGAHTLLAAGSESTFNPSSVPMLSRATYVLALGGVD